VEGAGHFLQPPAGRKLVSADFAPPGRYEYAFEVDGQMLLDPKADGTAPHPEFDKVSLLAPVSLLAVG
jgi:hypothetical protein